ncbi:MAG: hypothetical protein ACFFD5_15335 [Candidatus Thorarchaeota archaeon]
MSEEKKFESMLKEVKDLYLFLMEGEPSPDDEIEARETLIDLFRDLKNNNSQPEYRYEIEHILKELEDWDPLDLWFSETSIPKLIGSMLNIPTHKKEVQEPEAEIEDVASRNVVEKTELDLTEIVDKVSEQFKGEINGLRGKIEELKKELEKKDETLAKISQKKKVEKIILKKESRLPPPKIKIPVIKKPIIGPKIDSKSKSKEKKPTEFQEPVKKKLAPIPQISKPETKKMEEKLTPIPKKAPKITPMVIEESKDRPLTAGKRKVTSVIPEKPLSVFEPKEVPERKEKGKISMEKPKITSVRIEEIESESIQSSTTDLFNVFASVGEKSSDKSKPKTEIKQEITNIEEDEIKLKQKEIMQGETKTSPFVGFNSVSETNISNIETSEADKLPNDKDSLYQELIALEGRRYSIERTFKEIDASYNKGSIADSEYNRQSGILKKKLDEITTRINNIRRIISSM